MVLGDGDDMLLSAYSQQFRYIRWYPNISAALKTWDYIPVSWENHITDIRIPTNYPITHPQVYYLWKSVNLVPESILLVEIIYLGLAKAIFSWRFLLVRWRIQNPRSGQFRQRKIDRSYQNFYRKKANHQMMWPAFNFV